MSENTNGASQTQLSNPSNEESQFFDQVAVEKCRKLVDEYRKGELPKGDTLLEIQAVLQASIAGSSTLTQLDFKPGFNHFLQLLDQPNDSESHNPRRESTYEERGQDEARESQQDDGIGTEFKEKELRSQLRKRAVSEEEEGDEFGDDHEYVLRGKRRRVTAERIKFFPWLQPTQYRHLSSKRSEELTLECYEEWSDDVKYYRGQVTATPGCPSFPLSQWSLLLEGRAADLEKVLSGHYSTTIDPKQSQPLGKGFEITFSQQTSTHKVKTYGDWSIATDLWIEALTFIMPWKENELRGYKRYISSFFVDVHYNLHSRIIDFDKACRLKVEGQKYLRFDSITAFRRFEVSHLSSLGMVAFSEMQHISPSSSSGEKGSGAGKGGGKKSSRFDPSGRGPRFRRKMIWGEGAEILSGTALWTETAEPLPRPPLSEFENVPALATIAKHPDLFRVSTPVDIDRFESLLNHHPNQSFVRSVCAGLREGFWPWADTHYGTYPTTWDIPSPTPKTTPERDFLHSQIHKEESVGRYSRNFGPDLFPGMYSMPIHAVPKEGGKFRLVTNHSAGEFSLNSMIAKEDIAGVTLDNVQDLGGALREYRRLNPNDDLLIWKADVSEAYRHMPMHPLWQIKQVVTFDGERRIDRANVFGGRASQRIFHAFMSLVIWIAIFVRLIRAFIYVDDSFSFAKVGQLSYYVKYQKYLPSDMVTLLLLWDELGIPHEERKQIFGCPLPVIGFDVDPNLMKISLKDESKRELVRELKDFARYKSRRTLRDFEHIAGTLNWALNVCPLLRPGLSAVYAKTKGKTNSKGALWLNRSVVEELRWAAFHLDRSDGIYLFKSTSWDYSPLPCDVLRVFCDASGSGMGYWYPSLNLGFQSNLPLHPVINDIFYSEALCIVSAIHDAVTRLPQNGRLAVYTDSLNSVYLFNSLSGGAGYNRLLMHTVEVILAFKVDFRVFHVSGDQNVVADHLSRWRASDACLASPGLRVLPFQPPRDAMGAAKK
ncbi:hypothetical protein EDD22DRAFT_967670 [Suillus occidentalis]|nr:hypothetical protein EDD22DRAFT_967670 [Suillus occidentalis]